MTTTLNQELQKALERRHTHFTQAMYQNCIHFPCSRDVVGMHPPLAPLLLLTLAVGSVLAWRPSYAAKRLNVLYVNQNRPVLERELSEKRFGFIIGAPRSGSHPQLCARTPSS